MIIEREMKMQTAAQRPNISGARRWTARVLGGIAVLFMLFDGIGKLAGPQPVVEATRELGFAEHHLAIMGILSLLATLLYIVPRTAFLGALLLTGYLGGAVAAQVRIDMPLFTNALFPVYVAIFVWGALWLRDERVRMLLTGGK
ncbi:DoxX family protein [Cohnella rhizosphaerae]|uniref:DoxX family protein n=1 Tax=Cohnella rhizosphaerae TaxID=1457232 RepID=A0A9X4QSY3_9BACL|nr:DoxX family protein [Cohnella rhizosphaerae]MDG0810551.1 DoxX family protein [Cohnella rhizosphaerae]